MSGEHNDWSKLLFEQFSWPQQQEKKNQNGPRAESTRTFPPHATTHLADLLNRHPRCSSYASSVLPRRHRSLCVGEDRAETATSGHTRKKEVEHPKIVHLGLQQSVHSTALYDERPFVCCCDGQQHGGEWAALSSLHANGILLAKVCRPGKQQAVRGLLVGERGS